MDSAFRLFLGHVEKTLQFEYLAGDVTRVTYPHTTGWRTLPGLVVSHITGYSAVIQRRGMPDFTVKSRETICLCPGVHHRVEMITRKAGISRWSHVSFTILGGMDIFTVLMPPVLFRGKASGRARELNEALAGLHGKAEPSLDNVLREKSMAASLLALIAEQSRIRKEALPHLRNSDRIAPVLELIRSDLKQELRREQLAKAANLSPSRFDTLFKSLLCVPPMTYVHRLRLKEAQRLLLNSGLSVKEIASAVGHEDPFHFSRSFKQYCGSSPLLFRQQAGEGIL